MDALTLFGVLAVTAMLLFYALEGPAEVSTLYPLLSRSWVAWFCLELQGCFSVPSSLR